MTAIQPVPQAGSNTINANIVDVATGYSAQLAPGSTASTGALLVSSDGGKATYQYGLQAFTPVATPTAMIVIVGSGTKTLRIKRIRIGGVATAQGNMQIQFSRWSTVGTQGSAVLTAVTAVKHDINDPAATALVYSIGTANYGTQGTGNSTPFLCDRIQLATVATGTVGSLAFDFSRNQDKALIVRGGSDIIAISGNGSTVPTGGVLDISIEIEEDNS